MNTRLKGRVAGLVLLGAAFFATNAYPGVAPGTALGSHRTVTFAAIDSRMSVAQDAARRYLARFLEHVLDENGNARVDGAVKVALPAGDDQEEVIWVTPFAQRGGGFIGALANEPQVVLGHSAGEVISFDRGQVRDWMFIGHDGKMYGSYTTRVILPELDPAHAAQIQAMLSDAPTPAGW